MDLIKKIKEIYKRNKFIYEILKAKRFAKKKGFKNKYIICHPETYNLLSKSIFAKRYWNNQLGDIFFLFGLEFQKDDNCNVKDVFLINNNNLSSIRKI